MTRPAPAILILAAGASTRMRGADKLLEEVDGTPLILRATRAACAVSDRVIVALPPASPRRAWLGDSPAQIVEVADRAMSASIRAGVAACNSGGLLIHLADMPDIDAMTLTRLSTAWQASDAAILRATDADGTPGQPVVFASELFPELLALTGDTGARNIIARHRGATCALPGRAATTDLDTPEAWAEWRAGRG